MYEALHVQQSVKSQVSSKPQTGIAFGIDDVLQYFCSKQSMIHRYRQRTGDMTFCTEATGRLLCIIACANLEIVQVLELFRRKLFLIFCPCVLVSLPEMC